MDRLDANVGVRYGRQKGIMIVYAVGDGATGTSDAVTLAATIAAAKPDAFFWLGDVYESGTVSEFTANYQPSWGALDSICYPIPGNHDFGNYATGYQPYFSKVTHLSLQNPWYSFTLGDWTVLACNSESPVDVNSDQYKWAQAEVQKIQGRKGITLWHRPRYCSGSHGDAQDLDPLWQLVAPHCAVVLGGHAHNMQHFKPDATGCVQLVSGAGGRSLYAELPNDPRLDWGKADGFGAVKLTLGDTLGVEWIDEHGISLYQKQIG